MRVKPRERSDYCRAKCCANCKHVFVYHEYDSGPSYYCTLEAEKRPLCGSVLMKEEHEPGYDYGAWIKWEMENEVRCGGVCSSYELDKP